MSTLESKRRVLIVSNHPIFAETINRLAREAGYDVMAKVSDLQQALRILKPDTLVTVIVDHADARPRKDDWLPLLEQADIARRVILLTLAKNEMIVHEQRRVTLETGIELKQTLEE